MYPQWKTFEDHSFPYLNGNGFAVQCKHIWNYDGYRINPFTKPNNWVYVKTDYIANFFSTVNPQFEFVIFTGNSDYSINESHLKYLDDPRVLCWFAQNANIDHPKMRPIPIGLAPIGYSHGDINAITKVRNESNPKDTMFYTNFSVQNNRTEREYCLQQTGLSIVSETNGGWNGFAGGYKLPNTFEGYLRDMSKCYFCLSPKGNGIDCHRTWEALYLKTIPIVTRSLVADAHADYPIIILDDWSDFKKINFSKELYEKIWNNFDPCSLHTDNYMRRLIKKMPSTKTIKLQISQGGFDSEFAKKLVEAEPIFQELYKECNYSFQSGHGSYLFEGTDYEYSVKMYPKQEMLYRLAQESTSVLEIGTYMGHSLLIMLLGNPKLKITSIDINDIYTRPAINVLRKHFPNSEIIFRHGDSIDQLPLIRNEKFDLFHIDGKHLEEHVREELGFCEKLSASMIDGRKTIRVVFDDIHCCSTLVEEICNNKPILNNERSQCIWENAYIQYLLGD